MPIPRGFIPGSDADYYSYDHIMIDNIHIDANTISSTNPNGDIEFHPDADGEVKSHKSINILSGGLKINDTVIISDSRELCNLTQANVDNLRLEGNTISSTNTDGNLEITPDGTGKIKANKSIDITSGGLEINGTEIINGSKELTNLSQVNVDNIILNGNAITTSNTDGNLELTPNGNGKIKSNKSIDITSGGIEINGTEVLNSSRQLNNITQINIDNIKIDGNAVTSTNTDGNIDLTPNGNGIVIIPKVNITSGNISDSNITVGSGKTLDVSSGSLILANQQISGDKINGGTVQNLAITNLTGPMDCNSQSISNANIGSSSIDGTAIGNSSPSTAKFSQVDVDNINIDGNTIVSSDTNGNINLTPNGTGSVVVSNIDITDGVIGSSSITNINEAVNLRHSNSLDHDHSNKSLLDTYTQSETDISDAVSKKHNHSNQSLLDSYTQTETDLNDAVGKKHTQNTDSYTNQLSFTVNNNYSTTSSGLQQANLFLGNSCNNIQGLESHSLWMNCGSYYDNGVWRMVKSSALIMGVYPTHLGLYKATGTIGGAGSTDQVYMVDNYGNMSLDGDILLANGEYLNAKDSSGTTVSLATLYTDNEIYLGHSSYPATLKGSNITLSGDTTHEGTSNYNRSLSYTATRGYCTSNTNGDVIKYCDSYFGTQNSGKAYIGARTYGNNGRSFHIYTCDTSNNSIECAYFSYNAGIYTRGMNPFLDNTYDIGNSSYRWDDIYATNGTIQTSDCTQKEDISDLSLGLDFINELRPVSYKWKDYEYIETKEIEHPEEYDDEGNLISEAYFEKIEEVKSKTFKRKHTGLIAQEVEDVLNMKEIDTNDFAGFIKSPLEDGSYTYGWRPSEFIAPLIKAVQELSIQNQELKERIEILENLI